jgi:hypothetical protein
MTMPFYKKAAWLSFLALLFSTSNAMTTFHYPAKRRGFSNNCISPKRVGQSGPEKGNRRNSLPTLKLSRENAPSASGEDKTLVVVLNEFGQSLKPRAEKASENSSQAETRSKKLRYALQSSCYYMLFILYRGYRGFFVLLPAVFRTVYAKLQAAMDDDLALDTSVDAPSTTPWRTRITVTVLATIVTFSYVLGGVLRVATKFFRTIVKTTSVPGSFEAAVEEIIQQEDKLRRIANGDGNTTESKEKPSTSSGLSP